MHEVYLCLDVGGTEIKAAPLDANGKMLSKIQYFPAMACADRRLCLNTLHIFLHQSVLQTKYQLKLIWHFQDRLTMRTASACFKDLKSTMHFMAVTCAMLLPL